jgi:hypothetical protein
MQSIEDQPLWGCRGVAGVAPLWQSHKPYNQGGTQSYMHPPCKGVHIRLGTPLQPQRGWSSMLCIEDWWPLNKAYT